MCRDIPLAPEEDQHDPGCEGHRLADRPLAIRSIEDGRSTDADVADPVPLDPRRSVPPLPRDEGDVVVHGERSGELGEAPLGPAVDPRHESVVDERDLHPYRLLERSSIVTARNPPRPISAPTIISVWARAASCSPATSTVLDAQSRNRPSSRVSPTPNRTAATARTISSLKTRR